MLFRSWASRSYRDRKMAKYFDAVLALLPFEAPFFEKHGLPARFVGHPALERGERMVGGDLFRQACGIANYRPLLAVLPGSRRNEIRFILPVFKEAVRLLVKEVPDLICVLPTMPHVAQAVHEGTAEWPTPIVVVEGEREKYAAFDAADVALAASGTVTTELALAKTPMVVGYKVGGLTFLLSKPLMNIRFITLINLILDREAVPEFLQDACTPENLATALLPLVRNKLARTKQLSAQAEALRALGQGAEAPSTRAARALLELARR